MPYPPIDGGSQAIHSTTVGLLSNGEEVHVLAVNPTRNFVHLNSLPESYKQNVYFRTVIIDTRLKPLHAILNLFSNQSYFITRFNSVLFTYELIKVLKETNFDIVQVEHLYLSIYIDIIRKFSDAKIIFRPQNVEFQIWKRYLKKSYRICLIL